MLMINDSHPLGLDVSSYTIEEIDSITSEYTLKNTVCEPHQECLRLSVIKVSHSNEYVFWP